MRNLILINSTSDTFTPTNSGAIGTWIWELCQCAAKNGTEPMVISKTYGVTPYPWKNTLLLEYPRIPKIRGVGRLFQIEQRITGWGHIRQRAYISRVERALLDISAETAALVVNNDIEMAVHLSKRFPAAFVLHHAHNCNTCSDKFRREFASVVSCATAVSRATARWNEDYLGFGSGDVEVLYNGVNCEVFSPALSRPPEPLIINFVGRTAHEKGPDLLLLAALQLAKRGRKFALQIIGSNHFGYNEIDEYQNYLSELVSELRGTGVSVNTPGYINRNDLPEYLRQAHIHVMPSRWDEPFGLATVEGMACGLPTVAANVGGIPEVVGDSALLFERNDVQQLDEHLDRLIVDDALRAEYSQRARKRALDFTWDHTWKRLTELTGTAGGGR